MAYGEDDDGQRRNASLSRRLATESRGMRATTAPSRFGPRPTFSRPRDAPPRARLDPDTIQRLRQDVARHIANWKLVNTRSYFTACPKGLEGVLADELRDIGAAEVKVGLGGCSFSGPMRLGYDAVLWLRSANRVMEVIAQDAGVHRREDLYDFVYEIDWLRYFPLDPDRPESIIRSTIAVDVGLGKVDPDLSHSAYTARTVKDAVVDQLAKRTGSRPNVDVEEPIVPLYVYIHNGQVTVYRCLSGHRASLHQRGYRGPVIHKAVLRENVAAGLLLLSGWPRLVEQATASSPVVLCDPMCGSGTLLVEAAMMATRTAPGLLRSDRRRAEGRTESFERWPDADKGEWSAAVAAAQRARRSPEEIASSGTIFLLGNDHHEGSIRLARESSALSGMDPLIRLSIGDAAEYSPSRGLTLVVTNPPWDMRLTTDTPEGGAAAWTALRGFLKRHTGPPGSGGLPAWVLTGSMDLTRNLFMRRTRACTVEAGGVDLRWLHYVALPPKDPLPEHAGETSMDNQTPSEFSEVAL